MANIGMMGSLGRVTDAWEPVQSAGGSRYDNPVAPANMYATTSPGRYSAAARAPQSPYTFGRPDFRQGLASSKYSSYINPLTNPDQGGVVAGQAPRMNAVQQAQAQGPSLAEIQAEMKRREVGAQLNANPANSALAGYMMGQ